MIKLYGHPISGNSHRDYTTVELDKGAHKQPEYLALNPLGQVPTLADGDVVIRDSVAILVYLARKYDKSNKWLPVDPAEHAAVQQWLSTATNEIGAGPAVLRAIKLFGTKVDRDAVVQKTEALFGNLFEPHLEKNDWLAGSNGTIADIACYTYIARANEGDFSLEPYPSIRQWLARVEAIEGFTPMMNAV